MRKTKRVYTLEVETPHNAKDRLCLYFDNIGDRLDAARLIREEGLVAHLVEGAIAVNTCHEAVSTARVYFHKVGG